MSTSGLSLEPLSAEGRPGRVLELELNVRSARKLYAADSNGRSDPYVVVDLLQKPAAPEESLMLRERQMSRMGSVFRNRSRGTSVAQMSSASLSQRPAEGWFRGGVKPVSPRETMRSVLPKSLKTETIPETLNPVWDQRFPLRLEQPGKTCLLQLTVMDRDRIGKGSFLGYVEHMVNEDDLPQLVPRPQRVEVPLGPRPWESKDQVLFHENHGNLGFVTFELRASIGNQHTQRDLALCPSYFNRLNVMVEQAQGLRQSGEIHVQTRLRGAAEEVVEAHRTRTAKANDGKCAWNQLLRFKKMVFRPGDEGELSFTVFDEAKRPPFFLGHVSIALPSHVLQKAALAPIRDRFPLEARPGNHDDLAFFHKNKMQLGALQISVRSQGPVESPSASPEVSAFEDPASPASPASPEGSPSRFDRCLLWELGGVALVDGQLRHLNAAQEPVDRIVELRYSVMAGDVADQNGTALPVGGAELARLRELAAEAGVAHNLPETESGALRAELRAAAEREKGIKAAADANKAAMEELHTQLSQLRAEAAEARQAGSGHAEAMAEVAAMRAEMRGQEEQAAAALAAVRAELHRSAERAAEAEERAKAVQAELEAAELHRRRAAAAADEDRARERRAAEAQARASLQQAVRDAVDEERARARPQQQQQQQQQQQPEDVKKELAEVKRLCEGIAGLRKLGREHPRKGMRRKVAFLRASERWEDSSSSLSPPPPRRRYPAQPDEETAIAQWRLAYSVSRAEARAAAASPPPPPPQPHPHWVPSRPPESIVPDRCSPRSPASPMWPPPAQEVGGPLGIAVGEVAHALRLRSMSPERSVVESQWGLPRSPHHCCCEHGRSWARPAPSPRPCEGPSTFERARPPPADDDYDGWPPRQHPPRRCPPNTAASELVCRPLKSSAVDVLQLAKPAPAPAPALTASSPVQADAPAARSSAMRASQSDGWGAIVLERATSVGTSGDARRVSQSDGWAAQERRTSRASAEQRASEQQRAAEQRAAEQRALAEQRAAEQRASSEQRPSERRASERRVSERRASERASADVRLSGDGWGAEKGAVDHLRVPGVRYAESDDPATPSGSALGLRTPPATPRSAAAARPPACSSGGTAPATAAPTHTRPSAPDRHSTEFSAVFEAARPKPARTPPPPSSQPAKRVSPARRVPPRQPAPAPAPAAPAVPTHVDLLALV